MRLYFRPLAPRQVDHELIWGLVGLCVLAGVPLWVWLLGPPPLRCPFHDATGLPCLTCGSTRALLALSRLRLAAAFRLNPLCALCWGGWALYVPYGLAASLARLPRLRLSFSKREWLMIRIAVPLLAALNWAWLIWDKR